jgi:excinuclease ABC subunit A
MRAALIPPGRPQRLDSAWVIDMGPGAGEDGGRVVASGTPDELSVAAESRTALYLRRFVGMQDGSPGSPTQ